MNEHFKFYSSFYEMALELPPRDVIPFLCAILEYGLYQKEPELSGIAKFDFIAIKPIIDEEKVEQKCLIE